MSFNRQPFDSETAASVEFAKTGHEISDGWSRCSNPPADHAAPIITVLV